MAAMASRSDVVNLLDVTSCQSMDEDFVMNEYSSDEDRKFDEVVGTLEDFLMDDAFLKMQNNFMQKNYRHFTDDEENKFIYMDIFNKYTVQVEAFIDKRLHAKLSWFSMADFMQMLKSRGADVDGGDVFEMLASLGDFTVFKDMMLSYKHEREGTGIDLSGLICVTSRK